MQNTFSLLPRSLVFPNEDKNMLRKDQRCHISERKLPSRNRQAFFVYCEVWCSICFVVDCSIWFPFLIQETYYFNRRVLQTFCRIKEQLFRRLSHI
jgi:hypothetical protein